LLLPENGKRGNRRHIHTFMWQLRTCKAHNNIIPVDLIQMKLSLIHFQFKFLTRFWQILLAKSNKCATLIKVLLSKYT